MKPSRRVLGALSVVLFLVWSNAFVANSFLLGNEHALRRLDWMELLIVRFLPAAFLCALYCFGLRREQSARIVRRYWRRLIAGGFFCVPGYGLALNYGQQNGIPPPIASLETALAPLFLMLLGVTILKERVSARKVIGFALSLIGLLIIAFSRPSTGAIFYPKLVAITALAPLSWSCYSILSKPAAAECSSILWTYLSVIFGAALLLPLLPFHGAAAFTRLDGPGWAAIAYLVVMCTLFGFAVWNWILKRLPASSIGFTIFLNPPMTTASKALLAAVVPATFVFQIVTGEWAGGAIVLTGMAVALTPAST